MMKIIEDHLSFMRKLYKAARENSPEMVPLLARRDYFQSVLKTANIFKAGKVADIVQIRAEIAAVQVSIDNSTTEEEKAEHQAQKETLETALEETSIQSEFSTVQAYRAVFPDVADYRKLVHYLQGFDTVEEALSDVQESMESLKTQEAKALEDAKKAYFEAWGYFIDNVNVPKSGLTL